MVKLVKSKHYRVPYMGSKQSIAERLIQAIHSEYPDAGTFKEKIKIVEEPYFDFGADFTWAEA